MSQVYIHHKITKYIIIILIYIYCHDCNSVVGGVVDKTQRVNTITTNIAPTVLQYPFLHLITKNNSYISHKFTLKGVIKYEHDYRLLDDLLLCVVEKHINFQCISTDDNPIFDIQFDYRDLNSTMDEIEINISLQLCKSNMVYANGDRVRWCHAQHSVYLDTKTIHLVLLNKNNINIEEYNGEGSKRLAMLSFNPTDDSTFSYSNCTGSVYGGNSSTCDSAEILQQLQTVAIFHFNYGLNVAYLSNISLNPRLPTIIRMHSVWNRGIDQHTWTSSDERSGSDSEHCAQYCNNRQKGETEYKEASAYTRSCRCILNDEVKRILDTQTNSGFYTNDPMRCGWRFQEVSGYDESNSKGYVYMDGWTMLFSPAYANNIFHSAQVLLNLLHLKVAPELMQGGNGLEPSKLKRIMLPTVSKYGDTAWAHELLITLSHIYNIEIHDATIGLSFHDIDVYFQSNTATNGEGLIMYMQEDVELLERNNPGLQHVYFEHVIIGGQMELASPFFVTSQESDLFRYFNEYYYNTRASYTTNDRVEHVPNTVTSNDPLQVTILLRSKNRRILNIQHVVEMLLATGLISQNRFRSDFESDTDPLVECITTPCDLKIVYFEHMSVTQQIHILHATDVLITPHGAGITNGLLYLRPHSVIIEIMTSPWYEYGYQPTALVIPIQYYVLPITRKVAHITASELEALHAKNYHNSSSINLGFAINCSPYPLECDHTKLLIHRRSLECYGIRFCDAYIDVHGLEVLIWQASHSIRFMKRRVYQQRLGNLPTDNKHLFYKKAYMDPL